MLIENSDEPFLHTNHVLHKHLFDDVPPPALERNTWAYLTVLATDAVGLLLNILSSRAGQMRWTRTELTLDTLDRTEVVSVSLVV